MSNEYWERYLLKGEENAISAVELAKVLGLTDLRTLRKQIEKARRSGTVICSSEKGYYLPADMFELRSYVARMTARAETTFLCLQGARALLRKSDGQQTLRGFFDES